MRRSAGRTPRPWDNRRHDGRRVGRDGRRERPRPHALQPPRGHPQGDRPGALSADLDRPVGGQRHRHAAAGPDPRAAAHPRPVRQHARGHRRAGHPGRHLRPGRRDVPRPLVVARDGHEGEIDARPSDALALAVRVGAPIFAMPSVLDQAGLGADRDGSESATTRRASSLESTGENAHARRPALDVFRDFVNSLDARRPSGRRPTGGHVMPEGPEQPGRSRGPRESDRLAAAQGAVAVDPHAQPQPPEVAHRAQDHLTAWRPVGEPAVRG